MEGINYIFLRWDLNDLPVWPMYDFPQEQEILYAPWPSMGSYLSLAILNTCLRDLQASKIFLIFILFLNPIKTLSKPYKNLKQLFKTAKDKYDPMLGQGVYQIPYSCGKSYIGQT